MSAQRRFLPEISPSSAVSRRFVLTSRSAWVRAGRSGIHGRGLYARTAIPAETRIIQYGGEIIDKAESARREEARLKRLARGGDGSVYVFILDERFDLDGRVRGNVSRLLNHSCAPNCRAQNIRGRIWIVSERAIARGEELTIDYGYAFADWRNNPCRCGTPACPGYIVNEGQRWRLRRLLARAPSIDANAPAKPDQI
jgi:hypothetical protein